MNGLFFRKHIRTFIFWYFVCLFVLLIQENGDWYQKMSTYIAPVFGGLFFTLFISPDAVWPVYKKGDKVWWRTYGEEDPQSRSAILQKRIFRFVSAYCFLFTLLIFNKKLPIYISLKDYMVPAVFALGYNLLPLLYVKKEKPNELPL